MWTWVFFLHSSVMCTMPSLHKLTTWMVPALPPPRPPENLLKVCGQRWKPHVKVALLKEISCRAVKMSLDLGKMTRFKSPFNHAIAVSSWLTQQNSPASVSLERMVVKLTPYSLSLSEPLSRLMQKLNKLYLSLTWERACLSNLPQVAMSRSSSDVQAGCGPSLQSLLKLCAWSCATLFPSMM